MKKLFITLTIITILFSNCKKEDNGSKPVEVRVSGLSANTSLYIQIDNQRGERILTLENSFGNKSYFTEPIVNPGDVLTIRCKSNKSGNTQGEGVAIIDYYYNGVSNFGTGGLLGNTEWKVYTYKP